MTPLVHAFRSSYSRTIRSPNAVIGVSLFYVMLIIVFSALWKAVTESTGGQIAGYTHQAMTAYIIGAECAVAGTRQRIIDDIGEDISTRAIEAEMLRPVSILGLRFADESGSALARATALFVTGSGLVHLLVGGYPSLAAAALLPFAVALGVVCNLGAQYLFGAVAFWLLDARAGWFIYQKGVFLLGGMLLPIQVLPAVMQGVIWVLPFWTMAYAPARLAAGYFEPWLLLAQLGWSVVLIGMAAFVFERGVRRLQRTGG